MKSRRKYPTNGRSIGGKKSKNKWGSNFYLKGSLVFNPLIPKNKLCFKCQKKFGIYQFIVKGEEKKACGTCLVALREKKINGKMQ